MPREDGYNFSDDGLDISSSSIGSSSGQDHFDLNSFSSASVAREASRKKKKKTGKKRFLKFLLTLILIGIITFSIVAGTFIVYAFTMVDDTMEENLNELKLNFTTTIYVKQENGEFAEYQRLHGMFNRIWVPYDEEAAKSSQEGYTGIPQNLADAFVAIEDKRFNSHTGVDWKRTISAFANLFLHFYSSNQGGSTITQQLVKNLTGDNSRKPSRKIREIMRARYLEKHYSKDVILECYLNTIPLGHGNYGVETAANFYFGKSVHELTLAQCATIAAITKSPTYYAPDDHPEESKARRDTVLREMYSQGYITVQERDEALAEELKTVSADASAAKDDINSYFVDALINQVVDDLVTTYGYERTHAENMFYTGGYKIYATVDSGIQSTMEGVFSDDKTYGLKGKDGRRLQGSMTHRLVFRFFSNM